MNRRPLTEDEVIWATSARSEAIRQARKEHDKLATDPLPYQRDWILARRNGALHDAKRYTRLLKFGMPDPRS